MTKQPFQYWIGAALVAGILLTIGKNAAFGLELPALKRPSFAQEVQPILAARCIKCHGGDKRQAGLDLRTAAAILRGATDGPVVVIGSAAKSKLVEQIESSEMPPDNNVKLTAAQLAIIKAWIDRGDIATSAINPIVERVTAKDRQHWSFRPLARPTVPQPVDRNLVRTPIDAFVLQRLQTKRLSFAAPADRRALARRVYFDLLGLPPGPDEVHCFVNDQKQDAFERLVDRLLASPHFGERWGRHWLDVAGYVDVVGGDNDLGTVKLGENKWRYRDYVVESFNRDKPLDRFLLEQIAGDELVDWRSAPTFSTETLECLIATGFLRVAADDTDENELNTLDIRHGVLQRTGETFASNLLGLTVQCAKCHDHKYEPIPQRDYYRLLACLAPAFNVQNWLQPKQRALPEVSPIQKAAIEKHNAELDRCIAVTTKRRAELTWSVERRLVATKLARLPEPIREDTGVAVTLAPAKRNAVQKYLADKFGASLKIAPQEISAAMTPSERAEVLRLDADMARYQSQRRGWANLQVVYDAGAAPPVHLLRRGNPGTPGELVEPGILAVLGESDADTLVKSTVAPIGSTGRRHALASRLTDWKTPAGALVARVYVNRVWQRLFGKGLVETTDNFGVTGARPTHPELLEWLASDFVANGGKIKPLLRTIVVSAVYRQASIRPQPDRALEVDPENRLLASMPLRRLESEALRDALLTIGGNLDRCMAGAPVKEDSLRRSLYLVARRNYHPALLAAFDQPIVATNCTCRTPSVVVGQALSMLNDVFVVRQAERLAERIGQSPAAVDAPNQIAAGFEIVLSRKPNAQEARICLEAMRRQRDIFSAAEPKSNASGRKALAQVCHMLLNSNEFLYVP